MDKLSIGGFIGEKILVVGSMNMDLGQRAAALSIQKFGAQSSLPTKEEVDKFKAD